MNKLYVCNIISKRSHKGFSDHCKYVCQHSSPHERDECSKEEFCNLHESGEMVKVKCRELTKGEYKYLREK